MKSIIKSFGIVKIEVFIPNLNTKQIQTETRFYGGICIDINNEKCIITPYISAFKKATFISYYRINMMYGNEESIQWENEHNVIYCDKKSKIWDYSIFHCFNDENLIFPKHNSIIDSDINFENVTELQVFGIDVINSFTEHKTNLIHSKLPKQKFYNIEKVNTFSGTLVYMVEPHSRLIKYVGFTSSDFSHNGIINTRIVPFQYIVYENVNIQF